MSGFKRGLILLLGILVLTLFAGTAMAAQQKLDPAGSDTKGSYLPTPKSYTADNKSNYPQEIYLPNELDPSAYRIHSNYSKNTDACASCHATHTAVGASLLQWGTVYDTCIACHDGTISSTYDVVGGNIAGTTKVTYGGMFGTGKEGSFSSHNVKDAVNISAAPGGTSSSSNINPVTGTVASWNVEFGCQSCHSPHGQGGNTRILSPDPNGVAWEKYNKGTTKGVALTEITAGEYKTVDSEGKAYFWIKGYPYSLKTVIYENGSPLASDKYTVDNTNGQYTVIKFNKGYTPSGALTADFIPALKVDMQVTDYLKETESIAYKSGMNGFCGACHTDYNTEKVAGSGHSSSGTYADAYRHKVGFDYSFAATKLAAKNMVLESGKATCTTCHFAHGANETLWTRTLGADWGGEQGGSSALKRLPNMGTCETCHEKGAGTEGYNTLVASSASTAMNVPEAQYVGSNKCQGCHSKQTSGWKDTLHSQMVRTEILAAAKDPNSATGWKNGQVLKGNQTGIEYRPEQVTATIGSKWKQRFLVGNEFLDKQWNIPKGVWESYGQKADWDKQCITCHATGYRVNSYTEDPVTATVTYDHSYTEKNVGCEACHGPGSNHVKAPSDLNIWSPAKQSAQAQSLACGYCHVRMESAVFKTKKGTTLGWREDAAAPAGQIYKPGDDWTQWATVPGLDGNFTDYYAGSPTTANAPADFQGMFYAANGSGKYDSKKHHQQYQDFVQSTHFASNTMSCSTCHSSHSRNISKEQLKLSSAATCASCHGTTMNLTQFMPMLGKTAGDVYVRSHTFSQTGIPQPAGAVEPVNP
ncbi:MAG: cytochrome c3 family protein [Bacillota bacterium]